MRNKQRQRLERLGFRIAETVDPSALYDSDNDLWWEIESETIHPYGRAVFTLFLYGQRRQSKVPIHITYSASDVRGSGSKYFLVYARFISPSSARVPLWTKRARNGSESS